MAKGPKHPPPRNPSGPKKIIRISEADVGERFNGGTTDRMATQYLRLTAIADRKRFGEAIREAARCYACYASGLVSPNDLHKKIAKLGSAAEAGQGEMAAELWEQLPERAIQFLRRRADNLNLASRLSGGIGDREAVQAKGRLGEILSRSTHKPHRKIAVPTAKQLRNPSQQADASANLVMLCRVGIKGTGETIWHAPAPTRNPARRQPEHYYALLLRQIWFEFKGDWPSRYINPRSKTLFVKMVEECFVHAGAQSSPQSSTALNILREFNERDIPQWQEANSGQSHNINAGK